MNGDETTTSLSRRKVLQGVAGSAFATALPTTATGDASATGAPPASDAPARPAASNRARVTSREPGEPVALQYFHEDWSTITENLERVAASGYDAIWIQQPAKNRLDRDDTDGRNDPPLGYQPVDLRDFDSALGTEDELRTLIDTAHDEGVEVYVDTVLNHMAAGRDPKYEFPQFGYRDFHHVDDPDEETKELLGLPDLDQSSSYVRSQLKAYVEKIADLGADGYRFDAVKHIPESFFAEYANQWAEDLGMFRVGEVLDGRVSYVQGYVDQGPGMHAFDYPLHFLIEDVFDGGDISRLRDAGLVAQDPFHAMPFVENHDVDGPSQYKLAHAFVLTIEGYPMVYNLYPDWVLGDDDISNMVWVKSNLAGGPTNWLHADEDVLAYEREGTLLVGLNNGQSARTVDVQTSWSNRTLNDYAGNADDVTTDAAGAVSVPVPAEGWVFYAPERGGGDPAPSPPTARFDVTPANPAVGEQVTVDAGASTDPDDDLDGFAWDVDGDGDADASGVQARFTFDDTGEHEVTLTVSDGSADTDDDAVTKTVTVGPPSSIVDRYDETGDGCIDVSELDAAVADRDAGRISRELMAVVAERYFEC
jgi:alpha-amylase